MSEGARDLVVTGLDALIRSVSIRELDESLATLAAAIRPPSLRTLDAMHLASALSVGGTLDAFVTYDGRLADAARLHALAVVTPGS